MEKKFKYEGEIQIDESTRDKVEAYARKNYPKLIGDKSIIIKEFANRFNVLTHKDGSPIILGKGILG